MFGENIIRKFIDQSPDKPHFKKDQVVRAPFKLTSESESVVDKPIDAPETNRPPEVLVDWRVDSVADDGKVNIVREMTPEEQRERGIENPRRNISIVWPCDAKRLAEWNKEN